MSYHIANGQLDWVNTNYSSVHKEVELSFTDHTIITETDHDVSTHKFSYGFVLLEHAEKLPNSAIIGKSSHKLLAISILKYIRTITNLHDLLVTVNPPIEKGDSKRRVIVVTNEL